MKLGATLTQNKLKDFLLNVALVRPVFIWGAPGIGKSSLVEQFAGGLGMECVSLLGSQLAPEDVIGVPQIVGGCSKFFPPKMIVREKPYVLFLDELNACSQEIQKAFYSLITELRVGEYFLPKGSIVIGAGNRVQDAAVVKPMSSALINRMIHVEMTVSSKDWLQWAYSNGIHPFITDYITQRPDHLWSKPPKTEETFSSPRSWHMLSDALNEYGQSISDPDLEVLVAGTLSSNHAIQFRAFIKQLRNKYTIASIISGKERWPDKPDERDILYFLAQSFRSYLIKNLPKEKEMAGPNEKELIFEAKVCLKDLAAISFEIAQMVAASDDEEALPGYFMVEIVRDLPRLVQKAKK
ncbi:MAG: MoxR family ATPase [Deltaproteobacteria bacterium]|jgi:MoxR-like ATPase|nr:MoxR family ATPase [Deltaproteobacteria bacterium]